jgi:hypothetical protein
MINPDILLLALKYMGSIVAASYGLYATLTDFHEVKDGQKVLSKKGYIGVTLLLLSSVIALSSDIFKDYKEDQDKHRTAEEMAKKDAQNKEESKRKDAQIHSLIESQNELKQINRHLVKVMSVANGYNALIRGAVSFRSTRDVSNIEDAIKNLLIKYVSIKIEAHNKLGVYLGEVDYGTHPVVKRYLNLAYIDNDMFLSKYRNMINTPRPQYFFEVRCGNLKILNEDKIQYARLDHTDSLKISVKPFPHSRDFGRLYNVETVVIDEVQIEELGTFPVNENLSFL